MGEYRKNKCTDEWKMRAYAFRLIDFGGPLPYFMCLSLNLWSSPAYWRIKEILNWKIAESLIFRISSIKSVSPASLTNIWRGCCWRTASNLETQLRWFNNRCKGISQPSAETECAERKNDVAIYSILVYWDIQQRGKDKSHSVESVGVELDYSISTRWG